MVLLCNTSQQGYNIADEDTATMAKNDTISLVASEFCVDVFVQERRNSSALAIELRLYCINPSA